MFSSWKTPFWSFTGRLAGEPRLIASPEETSNRLRSMIADLDAGIAECDERDAAELRLRREVFGPWDRRRN
jgi:hypothetical protein